VSSSEEAKEIFERRYPDRTLPDRASRWFDKRFGT
jgi:hypothetical protein